MSRYDRKPEEHDGGRRDHGRPGWIAHHEDRPQGEREEWVYCPICLATKDGWTSGGQPKFKGGLIRVVYRTTLYGRDDRGKVEEYQGNRTLSARCTCEHGSRWSWAYLPYTAFKPGAELRRDYHGVDGTVVEVHVPGENEQVTVSPTGDRRSA